MTGRDFHLKFKRTKAERNEHVGRLRAQARSIAVALDADMPLEEWERGLLRFVIRNMEVTADDHARVLRQWADSYAPTKKLPHYSHTDAAISYALMRQGGTSHYKAMLVLTQHIGVTDRALEKAIWPLLPDVCAYIDAPLDGIRWRDNSPPK